MNGFATSYMGFSGNQQKQIEDPYLRYTSLQQYMAKKQEPPQETLAEPKPNKKLLLLEDV